MSILVFCLPIHTLVEGGNIWEGSVFMHLFVASLFLSEDWKYCSEDLLCCTELLACPLEEGNLLMWRVWQINTVYCAYLGNEFMDYSRISSPPDMPGPSTKGSLEGWIGRSDVEWSWPLSFCAQGHKALIYLWKQMQWFAIKVETASVVVYTCLLLLVWAKPKDLKSRCE